MFEIELQKIFDMTKLGGNWLCNEDKDLYNRQIESNGKIGYTTLKPAPLTSIHASKRLKIQKLLSSAAPSHEANPLQTESGGDASDDDSSYSGGETSESNTSDTEPRWNRSATHQATKMVIRHSLSTHAASKVCSDLAEEGVVLPTPTQSGVWRSVLKTGQKEKDHIKILLQKEKGYCLYFDGKKLSGNEYQVVCLQSESREIKLGVLKCKSGLLKIFTMNWNSY